MDKLRIISSTCASIQHGRFDLGILAWACESDRIGFNVTVKASGGEKFDVWIATVNHSSAVSLPEAVEICEEYFLDDSSRSRDYRIFTFCCSEVEMADSGQTTTRMFLAALQPVPGIRKLVSSVDETLSPMDEKDKEENPLIGASAATRVLHPSKSKTKLSALALALLVVCGLAAFGIFSYLSQKNPRYERYPTPGSIGPKHQSRLLWNNATEWARKVNFDEDKWRIRMDDQALVPAHLYNADEERYQIWFRQRYPHLQEIIERRDYLRPSWLGSSQISVPWDEQFHFAHCVLALRRYWIAKETGTHLCGRDIDYAHMKHCLDSLDEKAFPPGPMEDVGKGYRLWWQTKVCYD